MGRGGFGLKGAIKGAVKAGALNAVTGAFRSIGDGITDSGDKSDIKAKLNEIVNDSNKLGLIIDFDRCTKVAENTFFTILETKTGWSSKGVLGVTFNEGRAKLENLQNIREKSVRERILLEVVSEYPFLNGVISYFLSHYSEYELNTGDVLHFVKRMNSASYDEWMESDFEESLIDIKITFVGNERLNALYEHGVVFGIIDDNYNIVDEKYGPMLIMYMIESEMIDNGFSFENIKIDTQGFDQAIDYYKVFRSIALRYHLIIDSTDGNELYLSNDYSDYSIFVDLINSLNLRLKRICTIRGILCENINEAKMLNYEWIAFDEIYSPFDSYADYDAGEMQSAIEKAYKMSFKSWKIIELIKGENGLEQKRDKLIEREQSEVFKRSQQIVRKMLTCAGGDFYIYGSKGFIEKAKIVRKLKLVKDTENVIFPLVIYDISDGNCFKGFVITDNYLYSFNSLLGIGFGDKAIKLADVREIFQDGKKQLFKMADGSIEKIKLIDHEKLIIGVLSETYVWYRHFEKDDDFENTGNDEYGLIKCPSCGNYISNDNKFCTFCGKQMTEIEMTLPEQDRLDDGIDQADDCDVVEEKKTIECPRCNRELPQNAKFCIYCGFPLNNKSGG